jgi:hypothetical protein
VLSHVYIYMKWAFGKFYTMSRNEFFAVFAITIAVVLGYSLWGAYIIHTDAASPQVLSAQR